MNAYIFVRIHFFSQKKKHMNLYLCVPRCLDSETRSFRVFYFHFSYSKREHTCFLQTMTTSRRQQPRPCLPPWVGRWLRPQPLPFLLPNRRWRRSRRLTRLRTNHALKSAPLFYRRAHFWWMRFTWMKWATCVCEGVRMNRFFLEHINGTLFAWDCS